MYIIRGLRVIIRDTDIRLNLLFLYKCFYNLKKIFFVNVFLFCLKGYSETLKGRGPGSLSESVKKGEFVMKIFFSDNAD